MVEPASNQWRLAWRLGVYVALLIAVLVLTAVMPLIAKGAETDSTQIHTFMGLNLSIWFHNVEVTAARVIGRETVQYVSNIYKYYIAYHMVTEQTERKQQLMQEKSGDSN